MNKKQQRRNALIYHAKPKPGKTEVVPTKKYRTQRDLSLAYSPGVAVPCQEIEKQLEEMAKYEDHLEMLDKYFNEYQDPVKSFLAEDSVEDSGC